MNAAASRYNAPMPADPVDHARELLARAGLSASPAELQRLAMLVATRQPRTRTPDPATEPALVHAVDPWKPR